MQPTPATPGARFTDGPGQPQGPEPYIRCQDLFKIYKRAELEVVALRGVDLTVQQGEVVAIIGASGSGKSTLLNVLAGLDRPSAGQVTVGSRDLLDMSDRELVKYRRLEVGFVWQATARNLIPYLTSRDNIELPMAIAGAELGARHRRSAELLAALDMEEKSARYPHQLSGGEQQRIAIGVALANSPPLLLADEPTGELDTDNATRIFDMLRRVNQLFQVTVIMVTHYPGVAQHVDRVIHIRDGRISSESFLVPTFQRDGDSVVQEYLVVDRAGRLQLPQDYLTQLQLSGLAKADIDERRVTLEPPPATLGAPRVSEPPPQAAE